MRLEDQKKEIWEEYDKFKADYECSLKHNKPFSVMVTEIMDEKGITIEKLSEKSAISVSTINRLRSGVIKNKYGEEVEYLPFTNTIVAFCIACDVDMLMTITLLESLGLSFKRTSEVQYAYCYLIINCRGKTIDECNKVLENLNIDEKYFLTNRLV